MSSLLPHTNLEQALKGVEISPRLDKFVTSLIRHDTYFKTCLITLSHRNKSKCSSENKFIRVKKIKWAKAVTGIASFYYYICDPWWICSPHHGNEYIRCILVFVSTPSPPLFISLHSDPLLLSTMFTFCFLLLTS